jgi:hypothetical protein
MVEKRTNKTSMLESVGKEFAPDDETKGLVASNQGLTAE